MIVIKKLEHHLNDHFTLSIPYQEIPSGENLYIVGPSGSGKSTLIKHLCGLQHQEQAQVFYDGIVLPAAKQSNLSHLGIMYMSQELSLWPHMTVIEHLLFVMQNNDYEKAKEWLTKVQLQDHAEHKPHQLSSGEQQRLALVRALAFNPRYLFLDEPFTNLDLVLADELHHIILQEQQHSSFTLVQVSHHLVGLSAAKSNIWIMQDGKVVEHGPLEDIIKDPKGTWSKKWISIITEKV